MLKPYSTEWRNLLRRLRRVSGDPSAAEDALQSAYVRLFEYRAHNAVQTPAAFLARAAVNLAIDERRRAARTKASDVPQVESLLSDDSPLQDEVLAARQRLTLVRAALAQMPARTRDAFLMHRIEGLKYREIADRLGVSMSAVEKHIARAALLLAVALNDQESR